MPGVHRGPALSPQRSGASPTTMEQAIEFKQFRCCFDGHGVTAPIVRALIFIPVNLFALSHPGRLTRHPIYAPDVPAGQRRRDFKDELDEPLSQEDVSQLIEKLKEEDR